MGGAAKLIGGGLLSFVINVRENRWFSRLADTSLRVRRVNFNRNIVFSHLPRENFMRTIQTARFSDHPSK
jgi:hypothetical protein